MSQEQQPTPAQPRPYEVYGFTEQERLRWRISHARLLAILADEQTMIHHVNESLNNYGDFLFVTTSRESQTGRVSMTFYGLGFHEYREHWFTDEWYWYQARFQPEMLKDRLTKKAAEELIQQRLADIRPEITDTVQSERGRLFELLADLTDEDGAWAELQDLENFANFWEDQDDAS